MSEEESNTPTPERSPSESDKPPKPPTVIDAVRDEILRLHPHYGTREIGKRLDPPLSRKIVQRVLREAGLLEGEPTTKPSRLAPFRTQIEELVDKDLTTTRILREIRALGYSGGRTILAKHVEKLRIRKDLVPNKQVKRRFETKPGEEMQIDWSPYQVKIGGRLTKVRAFGCLLCYSRKLFIAFFKDERRSTLLEALARAFEYFGGCTLRVVLDNMSTAVLGRIGPNREPLWDPRFLDFAKHYGFEPFACAVADPDRKGKKEKSFRLVEDDFVKGSEFDSWDDLERRAKVWADETPEEGNLRVHGTTGLVPDQVWLSEGELLIQLPGMDATFPTRSRPTGRSRPKPCPRWSRIKVTESLSWATVAHRNGGCR